MTIVGARPQFIKASAVSRVISRYEDIQEHIVHTGQHYDDNMSALFFEELQIPAPDTHLGVGSGAHGEQTGRMLTKLEPLMQSEAPDWVLVYGDTNSTLAGALAAAKLQIPIAHVEAGLRSFNRRMPEEINRIMSDHLSDLLFAPTREGVANLAREGIMGDKVLFVGDVMYDVVRHISVRLGTHLLDRLKLSEQTYIAATIHRAENTDDPMRLSAIFNGFGNVGRKIPVVLPLHPRTKARIHEFGISIPDGVILIDPLGYGDMSALVRSAAIVVTDSGGLQKEAYFHGVPCVTLRDETEWVELVQTGWNHLVSPVHHEAVTGGILGVLESDRPNHTDVSIYGDGNAAERIVESILKKAS